MTNKEVIEKLLAIKKLGCLTDKDRQALNLAIKVLEERSTYEERPSSCSMTNTELTNIATIDTIQNRVERMICKFCNHYNGGKWSEPCVLCEISQVYMILHLARNESEDKE